MALAFNLDHVGISLTPDDLDATIHWYTNKLDFAVDERFDVHGTTFAFLTSGDVKVELLAGASRRHGAPAGDILASLDPGRLHHLCIAVEDLDGTLAELRHRDVQPVGEPMEVAEIGQRVVFITDNIGTIIELTEPTT